MTFVERTEIAKKVLDKQLPVTLEEARAQAKWLKNTSVTNLKKQRK